jgi:poly(3-hydroxybutyrate) depolymerase
MKMQPFSVLVSLLIGLAGVNASLPLRQSIGRVSNVSIESNGLNRSYLVSIPPLYKPYTPTGVIFSFHGGDRTATDQLQLDQLTNPEFNTRHIVVYPQGVNVC